MPATLFLVRAVVAPDLRDKFDHWYSADHLPWAIRIFKCDKAWRFWSEVEEGVHYAAYRFADKAILRRRPRLGRIQGTGRRLQPHLAGGRRPHARRGDAGRGAGGAVSLQGGQRRVLRVPTAEASDS